VTHDNEFIAVVTNLLAVVVFCTVSKHFCI